jgi:hypothetical protein
MNVLDGPITLIIAGIVAYIAWQQHIINREKLRLELFDRRFAVYNALKELLQTITRSASVSVEDLNQFKIAASDAEFLFDDEIALYLKRVFDNAVDFNCVKKELDNPNLAVGGERTSKSAEVGVMLKHFGAEIDVAKHLFGQYLRFRLPRKWNKKSHLKDPHSLRKVKR